MSCHLGYCFGGEAAGGEEVGGAVAVGEGFGQAEAFHGHGCVAEVSGDLLAEGAVDAVVFEGDDEAEVAQAVEGGGVEARHISRVDHHWVEAVGTHQPCGFESHLKERSGGDDGHVVARAHGFIADLGIVHGEVAAAVHHRSARCAHHHRGVVLLHGPFEHRKVFLGAGRGKEQYAGNVGYHRHVEKSQI